MTVQKLRGSTGHETQRRLSSGFRTVRLVTCLFHKHPQSPDLAHLDFFVGLLFKAFRSITEDIHISLIIGKCDRKTYILRLKDFIIGLKKNR